MSKSKLLTSVIFVFVFLAASHFHAFAQSAKKPNELQAIYACKSITDAQKRLACYDASVGRFEAAEKSGEVVTISKTAIEEVKRDAFGFNLPSLPSLGKIFGGNDKSETKPMKAARENDLTAPVKEAERTRTAKSPLKPATLNKNSTTSTVTEVTLDIRKTTEFGYKKTRFFMTNGQVWEQTDGTKIRIPKVRNEIANTAKISKASLGSFFLRINGKGSAIRVRRVR